MSRDWLRSSYALLRALILVGALVSVIEPQVAPHLVPLNLVETSAWSPQAFALDGRSAVRIALTAVSLALL